MRPWYHDFSRLGLSTAFGRRRAGPREVTRRLLGWLAALPARRRLGLAPARLDLGLPAHTANQRAKEAVLLPMLADGLSRVGEPKRALELFCADGYYAAWIARSAPRARVVGVDRAKEQAARAAAARRALQLRKTSFVVADVNAFVESAPVRFDLVFCAGGLYHLDDPHRLLAALRRICHGSLILQSAVTLATDDPRYFVRPAPGWRHGCRFTHACLASWLEALGWEILDHRLGELPANRRLSDRGSSYYLARVGRRKSGGSRQPPGQGGGS
ncbi:MAG: class I SAM-dependent methyltransferase [Thermoanaerobaculia bacterium]|nr:class I SAM-dependent methyltransferase [Thermoanaerobaculia bacterium]